MKSLLSVLLLLIINVIVYSGFTGVGYPKIMPTVLADHVEKNGLQGKLKFNLFVGASTGAETEDRYVC
jgi:acetyl-CoA hydrolase